MLSLTSQQLLTTLIPAAQTNGDSNSFLYLDLRNVYIINKNLVSQTTNCGINGGQHEIRFDKKGMASVNLVVATQLIDIPDFYLAVKNDEARVAIFKDAVIANNMIEDYCEVNSKVVVHEAINGGFLKVSASDIDLLKVKGLINFQDENSFYISPEGFEKIHSVQQADVATVETNGIPTMDIFISHSSKDAEIAEALINLLRSALNLAPLQIRCTSVVGYKLKAGTTTDQTLQQEVHDSKVFIGLITKESLRSAYVLFELGARWGAKLHLIPMVAADADFSSLQGPLSGIHAVNSNEREGIQQLVGDVADSLGLSANRPEAYEKQIMLLLEKSKQAAQQRDNEEDQTKTPEVVKELKERPEIRRISKDLVQAQWADIIGSKKKVETENHTVYIVKELGEVTVQARDFETASELEDDAWIDLHRATSMGSMLQQYYAGRFIP